MAKYRLTAAAVIDDVQQPIGYEFEFDGVPGPHMEPLDAAAKKAVADRDKATAPAAEPDMTAHPAETTRPGTAAPKEDKKEDDDRAGPGGHRRG